MVQLYDYDNQYLNFNIFINNNNKIVWNLKNKLDIYDIFILIFICKIYKTKYKSNFSNNDLDTFDFKYNYSNYYPYKYYIDSIYNNTIYYHSKNILIKVKNKFEAYIIYILSKIFLYQYKIEKSFNNNQLIKNNSFIKKIFYPKLIKLNITNNSNKYI